MASGKEIRRRIKSINNTKKITRAMEMVSAAKMRKAVNKVLQIRPYARSAWSVLTNLAQAFAQHKRGLLEVREVRNILMIVITSNRGLCGSFNSQIIKKVKEQLENPEKLKINRVGIKKIKSNISDTELKIDFVTIGKKGEATIKKMGRNIIASFSDLAYIPTVEEIRPLVKLAINDYLDKKYDKVVVVYTDYISTINQQTKIRQLLPLSKIDIEKQIAEMDILAKEYGLNEPEVEYKVEPSPKIVQIYHAILESSASKESAQMVAMKNATEAAGEMAADLTFAYNQIRQMKITQEIAEISAGRTALEN
jgi:F-type H+-transporting ATPase subunit gamma